MNFIEFIKKHEKVVERMVLGEEFTGKEIEVVNGILRPERIRRTDRELAGK